MGALLVVLGVETAPSAQVFAANMAVAARSGSDRVLLAAAPGCADDWDLLFRLSDRKTYDDLLRAGETLSPALLAGYIPSHDSSGLSVLGAQRAPLTPERFSRILSLLIAAHDLVVIPLPVAVPADMAAILLSAADSVLLPVQPDPLALRALAAQVVRVRADGHAAVPLAAVVLATGSGDMIDDRQVADTAGIPVVGRIPWDRDAIAAAVAAGETLAAAQPRSAGAVALRSLVVSLSASVRARRDVRQPVPADASERAKEHVRAELIVRLRDTDVGSLIDRRTRARGIAADLLNATAGDLPARDREDIVSELLDEMFGLGCIEPLLRDPAVTEVLVNGPASVYVETAGRLTAVPVRFRSEEQLRTVIDRIVAPVGRRIDESMPLVDARLPDGSRVNAAIPPVALNGPTLTVRKFSARALTADDLVGVGTMSSGMAAFLAACVRFRRNIVISGGTGSGKTTLLNVLGSFIHVDERIITIEDAAELRLPQPHVVRLEARPPSMEGSGEITIRRLLVNALRMRPDRIIIGECRSGEALDMLQAMNTGHDGSLTTVHANTPRDALARIATLSLMSGIDLPERAVREQIGAAVHLVVQISRLRDGSRRIVDISELTGPSADPTLVPLFHYRQDAVQDGRIVGRFVPTGAKPSFLQALAVAGIDLSPAVFSEDCA